MKDLGEEETPVIPREELTSNAYDDICFQRVIVEEMGELLPAKLLAECDLSRTVYPRNWLRIRGMAVRRCAAVSRSPVYRHRRRRTSGENCQCAGLLRTGGIEEMEHTALCDQLETELTNQEFCGLSFLLRVWAPRP
jgi:hypothetical protein